MIHIIWYNRKNLVQLFAPSWSDNFKLGPRTTKSGPKRNTGWYLQRNVKKLNLKTVTFWDNILFNPKQYEYSPKSLLKSDKL